MFSPIFTTKELELTFALEVSRFEILYWHILEITGCQAAWVTGYQVLFPQPFREPPEMTVTIKWIG